MKLWRFLWIAAGISAALLGTVPAEAAGPLRSPWDVPVAAHAASGKSQCSTAPDLPASIKTHDYYSDSAHSVIDPVRLKAYQQSISVWHHAASTLDRMADRYRANGDTAMAGCVADWLDHFAQAGTLTGEMSTNQATYVQGWMLGSFSIAWLKVRMAPTISAAEAGRIGHWLGVVGALNRLYYAPRATKTDGRNNHRYWAGLAVMAAAIAADRRDLYDWGVNSFGIGAAQITPEGTLPLEMARRALALHYHLFAAAPLVTMAELASANGDDLYHEDNGALLRLVHAAVAGISNPAPFAAQTGIAQRPIKLNADDIAWAAPFERRFPDRELQALLSQATSHSVLYIGGLPPA